MFRRLHCLLRSKRERRFLPRSCTGFQRGPTGISGALKCRCCFGRSCSTSRRNCLASATQPDLSCVDYYMGMGRIKRTFEEQGLSAQGYEVHDSPTYQNACTLEGFIKMILFAIRLFEEALGHWGTVCSSWVVLSRNSTLRTPGFIRGDSTSSSLWDGNTIGAVWLPPSSS